MEKCKQGHADTRSDTPSDSLAATEDWNRDHGDAVFWCVEEPAHINDTVAQDEEMPGCSHSQWTPRDSAAGNAGAQVNCSDQNMDMEVSVEIEPQGSKRRLKTSEFRFSLGEEQKESGASQRKAKESRRKKKYGGNVKEEQAVQSVDEPVCRTCAAIKQLAEKHSRTHQLKSKAHDNCIPGYNTAVCSPTPTQPMVKDDKRRFKRSKQTKGDSAVTSSGPDSKSDTTTVKVFVQSTNAQ